MAELTSTPVQPLLRAVANGRLPGSDTLLVTLVATPRHAPKEDGAIGFASWPSEMARRFASGTPLWMRVVDDKAAQPLGPWMPVDARARKLSHVPNWTAVDEIWGTALGALWAPLAADILQSLRGGKHEPSFSRYVPPDHLPPIEEFDAQGAIIHTPPRPQDTACIAGIIPVAHVDATLAEEMARATLVLRVLEHGPRAGDPPSPAPPPAAPPPKPALDEDIRAERFKQYKAAVCKTQQARQDSKATSDAIKTALDGKPWAGQLPNAPDYAATHVYGTWLQRSPPEAVGLVPDPALARARGNFYALAGDPMLSRLFCLSVDLEIRRPAWLPNTCQIHLAAEDPSKPDLSKPRPFAIVATAARVADGQFWPSSIFAGGVLELVGATPGDEKRTVVVNQPDWVEQTGGVWRMGGSLDGGNARNRYELASLDVRRALEPADAVTEGARHNTAGFTLLDRGRAFQVARDMALAELHAATVKDDGDTSAVIVLHAEELTVARRVDVAAVASGKPVPAGAWRSLMHRRVRFDFDRPVEGKEKEKVKTRQKALDDALSALVPRGTSAPWFLDEGTFQPSARLVPLLGGACIAKAADGRYIAYDVLADEALYLWDGTPAGVLTDGAQSSASTLPFGRTTDLLTAATDTGHHRPPPQRYRVPYVFGVRSVFLGGGSPTVAEAAGRRHADGMLMLPAAADAARAEPKPFRRHEGIGAPVLLFPYTLAHRQDGAMGFEQLDQAIVRSNPSIPKRYALAPVSPNPDPYVPAADRVGHATTMRVFVAPEVSHDMIIRHGLLDGPGSAGVRAGGLRNVAYDTRTPPEPGRNATGGGFPMVQTVVRPGLTEEGGIYTRIDISPTSNLGSEIKAGIPVFKPMGRNTANARSGGYLPDPAIEVFCLRARLRGCDRLLPGHVLVPLYDGVAHYPHAMPLVVEVRRAAGLRAAPPAGLADFASQPVTGHMAADEKVGTGGKHPGVRVQHVTLSLTEGEDFDLEVTCLPSRAMLAHAFAVTANAARWKNMSDNDMAGNLLTGMTESWAIEALAATAHLRVCHAVARPSAPPAWGEVIGAVRPRPINERPNTRFELTGEVLLDLDQSDGFRIVAETPAPDGSPLDDRSRTRNLTLRRAGRWPHLPDKDGVPRPLSTRDVVGFHVREDATVSFPPETVTLLEVSNLPMHGAVDPSPDGLFPRVEGRHTVVDLGRIFAAVTTGEPLTLPMPVPLKADPIPDRYLDVKVSVPRPDLGTVSRRMTLRLIALSRTAGAFETAPTYVGGKEPVLRRRSPLRAEEQGIQGDAISVTLVATTRPVTPVPRRPEPAFVTTRQAEPGLLGKVNYTTERVAKTRLWFARGLPSSMDVRVGIVLWPDQYNTQRAADLDENVVILDGRTIRIDDFADADLGSLGAYVTRWGGDPIRFDASPQTGFLIPPEAFADMTPPGVAPPPIGPWLVDGQMLPAFDGPAEPHRRVSLLTYTPRFDLERQEWFIDVDLRPVRASEPFARFGIVAFDPHAPAELAVSPPVAVTAMLLPHRHLTVTAGAGEVTVTLVGLGSLDIADLRDGLSADQTAAFQLLREPNVRLYIMHEQTVDGRLLRTPVLEGMPENDGATVLPARTVNGTLHWSKTLTLPDLGALRPGQLVAYVEEADRRMPATYDSEPTDVAAMFEPGNFVLSGPRFSARVPFQLVPVTAPTSALGGRA